MAMKTGNDGTSPITVKATASMTSPAISTDRAPMRSTRKPTGTCRTPETTLKATSAKPSCV